MAESVYARMGSAAGVARQAQQQQKADEERRAFFDRLPPPSAALQQYKIDKYGTAANQSFETYKQSAAGRLAIQQTRQSLGPNKVQGIGRPAAEERLNRQAEQIVRNRYVNSFVNARFNKDTAKPAGSSTTGNRNAARGQQASNKQEKDDLRNPDFRKATDFDKNNPFDKNNTVDRQFEVNRLTGERFTIDRFRSEVSGLDDVLTTHSFLVVFSPMPWVTSRATRDGIESRLTMRCDNAILPTINLLQEQNIRRYGYGPVENVAYGVNVGDFTLQFIVDKQASIVDFFEAWMNRIVNRDSYGGANINNAVGDSKRPYEVAYKDTYACPSVNVFVYDRAQNTVMEYNIYDVFPTGIQSMNLAWGEENSLMKLNVTFSFTDLRIRPKVSNFDNETIVPVADTLETPPPSALAMEDVPLVDPASIAASVPADLTSQPVVIGDGTNGAPRSVTPPENTPPTPVTTPQVEPPKAISLSKNDYPPSYDGLEVQQYRTTSGTTVSTFTDSAAGKSWTYTEDADGNTIGYAYSET